MSENKQPEEWEPGIAKLPSAKPVKMMAVRVEEYEQLKAQLETARTDALREALRIIDRGGYIELERIVNEADKKGRK